MKCLTCGRETVQPTCPACETPHLSEEKPVAYSPARVKVRPISHWRYRVSPKLIFISLAVGVVVTLGLYGLASRRAQERMEARWGIYQRSVTIEPGKWFTHVQGDWRSGIYDLEVIPHDGDVIVAYGITRADRFEDVDQEDIDAALEKGIRLSPGKGRRIQGRYEWGCCFWIIVNASKDKPVEVSIQFSPM